MAATVAPRVMLHVGTPKTGTTYLQDVLWRNRDALRERGVCYPGDRKEAHFLAVMDLQGATVEEVGDPHLPRAWRRLVDEVQQVGAGTVVVSHELFSPMEPNRVERALDELGRRAELHVICTARDLGRQLPAVWQEDLKNRHTLRFAEFLDAVREPGHGHWLGGLFWRMQDVPDVLRRWADALPAQRVHVVTVPPPGAPPGELWRRFCGVLGVDGAGLDATPAEPNASLTAAEAALLRRINLALPAELPWWLYERTVRRQFVDVAARRTDRPARLTLPAEHLPWVREQAKRMVSELSDLPCRIVGDPDDLLPTAAPPSPDPDAVTDEALLDLALDVTREVVQRYGDWVTAQVRQEPPSPRRRLVALGERTAPGRWALQTYRRIRYR